MIKELIKNNWDLIMTYIFLIIAVVLFYIVTSTCTGMGCVFGLFLVAISLLLSIAFAIIVIIRRIKNNQRSMIWQVLPALITIIMIIVMIVMNI